MQKAQARTFLAGVPSGKEFFMVNGQTLSSLKELRNALHLMDITIFSYHVNEHHNDFARWIADVIKDTVLAHQMESTVSLEGTRTLLDRRIDDLTSVLDKEYEKTMKVHEHAPPVPKAAASEHNTHPDSYYVHKEQTMKKQFHDIIVKEFFYGMATGIFISFILLRIFEILR